MKNDIIKHQQGKPLFLKKDLYNNPTPLTINILFCYSKEVLMNTYMMMPNRIIDDNNKLCLETQDIFNNNAPQYLTRVINAGTIQVDNLQNEPSSFIFPSGTQTLLNNYVNGQYPNVNALRVQYNATIVVFEIFFASNTQDLVGLSYQTGINAVAESCLALCRSSKAFPNNNYQLSPIILAHELGHLMGCNHSIEEGTIFENQYAGSYAKAILQDENKPYDADTNPANYGDIMTYASNVVLCYSNPTIFPYPEPYTNVAGGVVGVSEAYKVVQTNLPKLAGIFPP
ncbi:Metallo-peptidase family M12 [Candidatus Hepatincola sp. Pdp]